MKSKRLFLSAILILTCFCSFTYGAEVYSTTRSRKAIAKVKPKLVRALEKKGLKWGAPVFMKIFKEPGVLEVWVQDGEKFRYFETFKIFNFSGGLGPKLRVGDCKSPEGFYYVTPLQMNPASKFHLSFNLGYPNAYDRAHKRTGSALMVHGSYFSIGCYAMTDKKIEKIYALAQAALNNGQGFFRVHIFPFRMTQENMNHHKKSEWYDFWTNLKEGYDFFEQNSFPPNVTVNKGRYAFETPK